MRVSTATFLLLILSTIPFSKESNQNWTMGDNETIINTYVSKLTEEQRDKYYFWIGLRNSFYFSGNMDQLEKLVKYFSPEEEGYYKNLYNFSVPCCLCAGVLVLIIIFYLVRRFLMKGCRGPKIVEKTYHHSTYFFLILGVIIGLVCTIISLYNAVHSK